MALTTALDSKDRYTVGWIAALPCERAAAEETLDDQHERPLDFEQPQFDKNSYTWGRIGEHNVVIASLEAGLYGTTPAATTAMSLLSSFPQVRFGLLVGIGGGIPSAGRDLRLGDVAVGQPSGSTGGVVQYDLVKANAAGQLERKDFLNMPPQVLLKALSNLQAKHKRKQFGIPGILKNMADQNPEMFVSEPEEPGLEFQGVENDRLFDPSYQHVPGPDCSGCDVKKILPRDPRRTPRIPKVHYGVIASGNTLVKDAASREQLLHHLPADCDCICYEMEAAGLMNSFPCLVVRGICDYADSHKNKRWQSYAAATAAAFAKELLSYVPVVDISVTSKAIDVVQGLEKLGTGLATANSNIQSLDTRFRNDSEKRKNEDIANWLTRSTHKARHDDILRRCQEGTGLWFLRSRQFAVVWQLGPPQTLFCQGIPGAGKTTLASLAVQSLLAKSSKDLVVGFLYCSYERREEQSADDLLSTLLRQLALGTDLFPRCITQLHQSCQQAQRRPTQKELIANMITIAQAYKNAFLVVDALDECSEDTRRQLLAALQQVQKNVSIRCLVTSRPLPEICHHFSDDLQLEISAHPSDINIYAQNRIQELSVVVRNKKGLGKQIKKVIVGAVDGMFLLAKLHLDSLKDKHTEAEVEETLNAIKSTQKGSNALEMAYDDAITRINNQTGNKRIWARKLLAWVFHARRILSPAELVHALAVRTGDHKLNKKNIVSLAEIVSLCAGLVVIDEKSTAIQFVHYTTKEYLINSSNKNNLLDWIQPQEEDVVRSCLAYLTFDAFAHGPSLFDEYAEYDKYDVDYVNYLRDHEHSHYTKYHTEHALLKYASRYWGEHAQTFQKEVGNESQTFLRRNRFTATASQAMFAEQPSLFDLNSTTPDWHGSHVAAFFGLTTLFQSLTLASTQEDIAADIIDARDNHGRTPLFWAAEHGHISIVKILVNLESERVNVNTVDKRGDVPLTLAVTAGHNDIVKILIDLGPERIHADIRNRRGRTPLSLAAEAGNKSIVKLLLDLEPIQVDANSEDGNGRTPLFYAAMKGHKTIVAYLVNLGSERININTRDTGKEEMQKTIDKNRQRWRQKPSGCGALAVIERKSRQGIYASVFEGYGRTPLSVAAECGHGSIVRMLLDLGPDRTDASMKDNKGRTPAFWAERWGYDSIVKMLGENSRNDKAISHTIQEAWAAAMTRWVKKDVKGQSQS